MRLGSGLVSGALWGGRTPCSGGETRVSWARFAEERAICGEIFEGGNAVVCNFFSYLARALAARGVSVVTGCWAATVGTVVTGFVVQLGTLAGC